MKVTWNWLKKYVEVEGSPEQLGERLTMLGIEVEGIEKRAGEFEGVVVAQILASEKHPNADKLSVCRVVDGQGERQIVCGARNYQVGDKVPLALPGTTLPAVPGQAPFTIKSARMRGVESQGMLCSAKELQLADDAEGLMILAQDAVVGQPLAEHLRRSGSDVVYDLEITPNRPDWNSVIGIARELSAVTSHSLRIPDVQLKESGEAAASWVLVRVEDPELCPRYVARVIRGIKIGPSPEWLRQALESVGLRAINNVVDVTNYVMLETGQPLHAFDYHLLEGKPRPTIVVRRARIGETFVTLDGQKRNLTPDMLLIADEAKAVALAGVMGGQNTEIHERTVDVLLESAYFKPQNIRATSKKLEVRTDASYRFERGGDVSICEWASGRAAQLILEVAGGELLQGAVDAYPNPAAARVIALRARKTIEVLGIEIGADQQADLLTRLGLETLPQTASDPGGPVFSVRVPSFRVDLKREIDLIEEIARLYGVDRIPATAPRGAIGSHPFDAIHDQLAEARGLLSGLGLYEAQGQTLVSDEPARLATQLGSRWSAAPADTGTNLQAGTEVSVRLANPLSSDMNVLRPSLFPGLLDALRHNLNHKTSNVRLFELGRVFVQSAGRIREERRLGIALTGARVAPFWTGPERQARADVFDLKGILEEFLEQFGIRGANYVKRLAPDELFIESAVIQLGKQAAGELGQIHIALAKRYDLRDAGYLAELNFDLLLARRVKSKAFKALPAFPAIRRDVAMFVGEEVTHDAVMNLVKQAKLPHLESAELFDVFRGANLPAGQKSVAYAFIYRSPERTLTDAEVNAAHEKIVEQLKQTLHAQVRE